MQIKRGEWGATGGQHPFGLRRTAGELAAGMAALHQIDAMGNSNHAGAEAREWPQEELEALAGLADNTLVQQRREFRRAADCHTFALHADQLLLAELGQRTGKRFADRAQLGG